MNREGMMADVAKLVAELTLKEKASLTAGSGHTSTTPIERLGIPRINLTDGPNGARAGADLPGQDGARATCIPCGTAIGASWNTDLAERLGSLVGREALDRACRGLLAPTVNLHRSPLAGRNFECFSEDPLLSGRLAAAYVKGVQTNGVFATVKHFVGNEAEFQRNTINSVIDPRALRELYLLPFELAVKEGGALGVMTAYNRMNGHWLTEQREYLLDLLRDEWGFQGLVMSDWGGVALTETATGAGLDLEMPAPARALGERLVDAVEKGLVADNDVDAAVRRFLGALDLIGALDSPEPEFRPEPPTAEVRAERRAATTETIVLLKNEGVLPLDRGYMGSIALLGDHAVMPRLMGGGSAAVTPHSFVSPYEALSAAAGEGTKIVLRQGVEVDRRPAPVGRSGAVRAPGGFQLERFPNADFAGEPAAVQHLETLRYVSLPAFGPWTRDPWSARVRGDIVAADDGVFSLSLAQFGHARVFLAGRLVLDGFANLPADTSPEMWGIPCQDLFAEVSLRADEPVELIVEFAKSGTMIGLFRVGFGCTNPDELLEAAVVAAAGSDIALVFVGTGPDYESEGFDRESFQLPGRQVELIRRVAASNPRTVVVINGSVVDMSWADEAAAVLQCWFGGEEMAAAVIDVLLGAADPGGRLPTTIPQRIEHNPAYGNFPGENGELRYGEGLFMGYRGYEYRAIEPRFCFGHGHSYTSFAIGVPELSATTFQPGQTLKVSVPVTNTGRRVGWEVLQCYVAPTASRMSRPPKELKAFAKVWLEPGQSITAELVLDDRSFSYWDPGQLGWERVEEHLGGHGIAVPGNRRPGWTIDPGRYEICIGRSSTDIAVRLPVEIPIGS